MPDNEARDAWFEVVVDLPNRAKVTGRSIPFRAGLALKILLYKFSETISQEDFDKLWAAFEAATGVTEAEIQRLCPSITLLELTDLVSRFIYVLRIAGSVAPSTSGTPVATAAPAAPAPAATAESPASYPPS